MKERMKQVLCITFTICLCGLFLILNLTGCDSSDNESTNENSEVSFVIVEKELVNGYFYKIAYHKDTKVMYVLGQYNDFEVMLNADGKPLLWEDN
jgi:hypothetical protein